MNAILSPDVGEGLLSLDDLPPDVNSAGEAPATTMLPARRAGVFAAIQVDAREVRLLVSHLLADGSFQALRQDREMFNPGPRGLEDGAQIAIGLGEVLSRFQRTTELLGAGVRAVATQSFRALPNYAQLLQRLCRITRVPLQVISDREVARFICMAALRGRPVAESSLLVDVGENSTAVILANAQEPLALWQLDLGTARLAMATGVRARHPHRSQTTSWRKQIKDILSVGHLDAIRGAARDAILIRHRAWDTPAPAHGADLVNAASAVLLDEVACYLGIRKTGSTDVGLNEGILIDLAQRWQG